MIPVLLADDETLVRTAMATMLDLEDDIEVVAHVDSGEQLVALWRARRDAGEPTAVAVIDLQMSGMDGIDTAIELLELTPDAGTLIVTSHGRPGYLKRALTAGVRGFLPKTTPAATLAQVIATVHSGGRYIDPELATEAISTGDSLLTAREADVLEFALDGASVEEIARRAHLTAGTTRNYLSSAVSKLNASNRYEAAIKARDLGWI
ncbi:response regulator transcription factor [Gordonia terrae]|uniref:DNA-binding response regulator n=2 Tax=Gordonia terrae TaxID=2055 RepID=A0AAD0K3Z1_9ACTN|nr:response regulator transcription factor [Gordonia terrae]VTR08832.1 two component LuxR family transcriptional regulator [Clostridioides difficile]ANY21579.1 DNA-binding response regulator [Gordonia terrae]AWO82306.1 DNA-binding response regulator [Gordonia terrae]VTS17138.1 Transcriptional regulatory protein uhpA [Gordonia terrae]GAB44629.1 putative two-component response regulator [Gordonia terrae NBRC 100016]